MLFAFRLWLWLLTLSLPLISSSIAQSQSEPAVPAPQRSADEAALRALAEAFFRAWVTKDLDGYLRLWAPKSPDIESRKQAMQKLFADHDQIIVKNPMVHRVTVDGEKAKLRVDVEISAVELKTGKAAAGFGVRRRVMECVKENGAWRVWREESAFEPLAKALAETATEKERDALLRDEPVLSSPDLSATLNGLGTRFASQGLYPKAINVFRIAQSIAEKINDSRGLAGSLGNIGLVHFYQGDYDLALEALQKTLRLSEAIGHKAATSRAWNNLGLVYQGQGNFSLAIESYRKCLETAQPLGDKSLLAMALGNIGNIYNSQGNYRLAAEHYQKSQGYYRESGLKAGEGRILHSLGNIQHYQGNLDLALKFYKESLALKEQTGNRVEQSRTLNSLGQLYTAQGNYNLAEEFHRKSLGISEASDTKLEIAHTFYLLGDMHYLKGDHNLALEYFHKSLGISEAIGNKKQVGYALRELAKVHLVLGKPAQALEAADRATEIAKQIDSLEILWPALTYAGKAQVQLARPAQARQSFERAIAAIETLRIQVAGGEQEARGYFDNKMAPYHELVSLLVAQNQFGEALAYAEHAKARALLDVLRHGRAGIQKAMTVEEREQEGRLKSELTMLNTRLASATQASKPDPQQASEIRSQLEKARLNYEAFQTALYAAHPELKVDRGEAPTIKTEDLTALLPNVTSALLEYVVADDKTYLFVITKAAAKADAETQVYTLPIKRNDLAKQVETFRRQLGERDLGFRASAVKFYELLLKPAQAQLKGKSNLLIAPDDVLWELPFQALPTGAQRYLIEESAITYAPSLTVMREMTKRGHSQAKAAPATLLALGNPLLDKTAIERTTLALRNEKLDPLPEAEAEVKALGRLYGAPRSKVYIGAEAREDRLKAEAGQAGILHFATHGILNNASPLYSYLVLAQGDKNEDGLLEAWELMQLDLKADMATLSACETARGRFRAGEGVIGLTWALFVAGVPTTVVSQWKVESASTRELMLGFHQQLRAPRAAGKLTKAEALRQAAIKLMKNSETSHPFYWAGFVLVGDGR